MFKGLIYVYVNHTFHEKLKIFSVFPGIFGFVCGISKCSRTYYKTPHGYSVDPWLRYTVLYSGVWKMEGTVFLQKHRHPATIIHSFAFQNILIIIIIITE
jgi:hypothetical protein